MNLLPEPERERLIREENLERRKEIGETKKSLWKLRTKENKFKTSSGRTEKLRKLETLEEKMVEVDRILEELQEEKKNMNLKRKNKRREY